MKYVLNNVFYKPKEGLTPFKESINTFGTMNGANFCSKYIRMIYGLNQVNVPKERLQGLLKLVVEMG